MKTETILRDLETVKERLAAEAGDDSRRFLDQMDAWLEQHPHAGAMINSPEELQARLRSRGTSEPVPPPSPALSGSRSDHCRNTSHTRFNFPRKNG